MSQDFIIGYVVGCVVQATFLGIWFWRRSKR